MEDLSSETNDDIVKSEGAQGSSSAPEEALRRLRRAGSFSTANSVWYTSGADINFYTRARRSCEISRQKTREWHLAKHEEDLLQKTVRLEAVLECLLQTQELASIQQNRSRAWKATTDFTNAFCEFSLRFSTIVKILLPQNPEYTMSYGLLALLFKAVVNKKEKEDTIAEIFAEVNDVVTYAVSYYRTSRFGKLMDVLLETKEDRFSTCKTTIAGLVLRLNVLKDVGHIAQQADIKEVVEASGAVITRLYENFELSTAALSGSVLFLTEQLQSVQKTSQDLVIFHFTIHAHTLLHHLLPTLPPSNELLTKSLSQKSHMSQKDRWENNGLLTHLLNWSSLHRPNLLWIAGQSGNQDSWVTDFSHDLIRAMESQDILMLFVLCRNGFDGDDGVSDEDSSVDGERPITSLVLVKMIIAQILEKRPDLVIKLPGVLNERTVGKLRSFGKAWELLKTILAEVKEHVLLVIDRIDGCADHEGSGIDEELLPRLVEIAEGEEELDVIVTSLYVAPEDMLEDERISHVWIGTARRTF
ncbi:hypothetical protein BGZ57DRAFT_963364 [Hyaloscypha finlandica]|nr:hypothetical protein BGZ57DRAFT_963364 [Hyaloscypha finlandica]